MSEKVKFFALSLELSSDRVILGEWSTPFIYKLHTVTVADTVTPTIGLFQDPQQLVFFKTTNKSIKTGKIIKIKIKIKI